jgi:hypothetical protein
LLHQLALEVQRLPDPFPLNHLENTDN